MSDVEYFTSSCMVTIVIPAFNAEEHIAHCLESCSRQTYNNIEVILVNDGSTDLTKEVAENFLSVLHKLIIIDVDNGGQGRARNIALKKANGEFIFFLDADDRIHEECIEKMVTQALSNNADVVFCDWFFVNEKGIKFGYSNFSTSFNPGLLTKNQQFKLLRRTFFTVNKLYNKNFLLENEIFFGEGYIYEDVEFAVGVIIKSLHMFYIPYPFYRVHVNNKSTTKTSYESDRHSASYIKAVNSTLRKYEEDLYGISSYFVKHVLNRSYLYTFVQKRVPLKLWYRFIYNVLSCLSVFSKDNSLNKIGIRYRIPIVFLKKNALLAVTLYFSLTWLHNNRRLNKYYLKFKRFIKIKKLKKKNRNIIAARRSFSSLPLDENLIIFHGFNNALRGNTKYLLKYLSLEGYLIYIACPESDEINSDFGYVKKGSAEYYSIAARAKTHILESWTDLSVLKKPGSFWIQMWHGTPIKKMLFDSPERLIVNKYPHHKMSKHRDILRWDVLISQNKFCTKALLSSFSFDSNNIVETGYPRTDVFYNLDSDSKEAIKKAVKEKYNITKPILLYAPTWRDYNQYLSYKSYDYFMDLSICSIHDRYDILVVGHSFSTDSFENKNFIYSVDDDIQNLLIASDVLVTDYSSVIFDWILLNKPFALLWKDEELFEHSRGVYSEFKNDFKHFILYDERNLIGFIDAFPGNEKVYNLKKYVEFSGDSSSKICRMIKDNNV